MCNTTTYSESGAPIAAARCADYIALRFDRDRLAGVVAGMEDQGQRNLDALRRAEAEVEKLNKECEAWVVTFDAGRAREKALRYALAYAKFAISTTPQMNGFTQSTALELIGDATGGEQEPGDSLDRTDLGSPARPIQNERRDNFSQNHSGKRRRDKKTSRCASRRRMGRS